MIYPTKQNHGWRRDFWWEEEENDQATDLVRVRMHLAHSTFLTLRLPS